MASHGSTPEKMQHTPAAVNVIGSLGQAESQIDRAQQGMAGSLEASDPSSKLPKPYHILGFEIMAYSHPRAQAFLLGCVLFLTVGTYNVITFLGGAGQQTAYLSDGEHLPNLVCYAFDGSSKLYISMGFEFPLVVASILPTQVRCGVSTIPVTCWCGLSAAMLWCAEGMAMMAFASEDKKGLSVSIMWSIFQSGVVIGSAIPVGQNWNAGTDNNSRVNDGTYIGLMILILFGAVLALVLYPWQKMIREDGSKVLVERHLSFFQELASSCNNFNGEVFTEGLLEDERLDVYDPGYGAWAFLYVMYGFMDAAYNCYAYWFMGALSNDPVELSVYTAMFRLLNSVCQITTYALNLRGYSKEFMFGTSWAFVAAGLICILPIIKFWMKESNMVVVVEDTVIDESVQHASAFPSDVEDMSKSSKMIQG
ncbi:hypothetical protein L207DRAFT_522788 [Hyaloscypha variabilis F]|uniref:MFS general substrate transporter n=1 Tax=Hyaloscypha variabilis (strain UAMH 11265 / GT02V1 / F) TaxID=1149755 RepID=A0A2J6S9E3_HYAVF|nr:hypothetical protein L207DRAFT_522788 [Hyaloscypha variabilis F]